MKQPFRPHDSGSTPVLSGPDRTRLIPWLLVLSTLIVFFPTAGHQFVDYDDTAYVTENRQVQKGLSLENVRWAFTAAHAANWHPLTWLSHMLDVSIFGMNPAGHHLTSLALHVLNALVLYFALVRGTGRPWRSGMVAALFALHPLHVESVAWVSERKDVLSTFFWFLTLWGYIRYTEKPGAGRYLPVLLGYLLGLMAKPMVITLPFTLLLLDAWPLGRMAAPGPADPLEKTGAFPWRPVMEKIPFFLAAAASCAVTLWAQGSGGAIAPTDLYPPVVRAANALVAYVRYLVMTFWPSDLAVLYPHPGMPPLWQWVGALGVLVAVTVAAILAAGRRPWMLFGWLWYLGTLVPVIGLVQVGAQALADRYTYVPLVGLFISFTWAASRMAGKWSPATRVLSAMAILAALAAASALQVRHWADSEKLFRHAIAVTRDNYVIHYNLGNHLAQTGRTEAAVAQFRETLAIRPDYAKAHNNLGVQLAAQGKAREAADAFDAALAADPMLESAYLNRGNLHLRQGRLEAAMDDYGRALAVQPRSATAFNHLGLVMLQTGALATAVGHLEASLALEPENHAVRGSLSLARSLLARIGDAADRFRLSLAFDPDAPDLAERLAAVTADKAALARETTAYATAVSLQPGFQPSALNLNRIAPVADAGRAYDAAYKTLELALARLPDNPDAAYHLACLDARAGNKAAAQARLHRAVDGGFNLLEQMASDRDLDGIALPAKHGGPEQ